MAQQYISNGLAATLNAMSQFKVLGRCLPSRGQSVQVPSAVAIRRFRMHVSHAPSSAGALREDTFIPPNRCKKTT